MGERIGGGGGGGGKQEKKKKTPFAPPRSAQSVFPSYHPFPNEQLLDILKIKL
jgi:hypothetical protein